MMLKKTENFLQGTFFKVPSHIKFAFPSMLKLHSVQGDTNANGEVRHTLILYVCVFVTISFLLILDSTLYENANVEFEQTLTLAACPCEAFSTATRAVACHCSTVVTLDFTIWNVILLFWNRQKDQETRKYWDKKTWNMMPFSGRNLNQDLFTRKKDTDVIFKLQT